MSSSRVLLFGNPRCPWLLHIFFVTFPQLPRRTEQKQKCPFLFREVWGGHRVRFGDPRTGNVVKESRPQSLVSRFFKSNDKTTSLIVGLGLYSPDPGTETPLFPSSSPLTQTEEPGRTPNPLGVYYTSIPSIDSPSRPVCCPFMHILSVS